MGFHDFILLRRQAAGFVEDILPNANLANIVEQSRLFGNLHQRRIQSGCLGQFNGVVRHIL